MTKWAILALLVGMAAGIGLWIFLDPEAGAAAAQTWDQTRAMFVEAGIGADGTSIWAPVANAFQDFADSVAGLWAPSTIQIEVPSVQVP
jgi:hypothetical protein